MSIFRSQAAPAAPAALSGPNSMVTKTKGMATSGPLSTQPPRYEALATYGGMYESNKIVPGPRRRILPALQAVPKLKQSIAAIEMRQSSPYIAIDPNAQIVTDPMILKHLFLDPINLLLIFVPVGFIAAYMELDNGIIFCFCFLGLIPLAKLMGDATEHLAENLNETIGGVLNATVGNAAELIITLTAINAGLFEVVKQSLLGSVLSNLLLVLGMSFFAGGLTRKQQEFPDSAALINISMLLVSVMAFSLPTIFSNSTPEIATLKISRLSAVFVFVGYIAYLVFQLYSHIEIFENKEGDAETGLEEAEFRKDTAVEFIDSDNDTNTFRLNNMRTVDYFVNGRLEVHDLRALRLGEGRSLYLQSGGVMRRMSVQQGQEQVARRAVALVNRYAISEHGEHAALSTLWALALLIVSTIVVTFLSELFVDSIEGLTTQWGIPEAFVGVVLLPIVSNACEHASAIRMAFNNKVATSIAIAVGSSTQIAFLVMPISVITAWIVDQPLDLNFGLSGLAVLFLSVLVVFSIVTDGKSNWLEGFMLMLAYCLVAVLYWYTPKVSAANKV